jgi:dTDP-4-amino-4,6-dideoxygalactose transaminase
MAGESEGAWYYLQTELGYNYRMTDLQAALGSSQMRRMAGFVARRRELAERYGRLLADLPLDLPPPSDESAWHLYPVRLRQPERRRAVFDALRGADIGVNVHYIPVHLQPWYRGLGFRPGDFPEAEAWYAGALSLPLWPGLSDALQDRVIEQLANALREAP